MVSKEFRMDLRPSIRAVMVKCFYPLLTFLPVFFLQSVCGKTEYETEYVCAASKTAANA